MLLFAGLYAYGAIAVVDAVGDGSSAAEYAPRVINKHYTTGRSRSYYLVLEPWGPMGRPNSIGVSKKLYDNSRPGDSVCLELRHGRLDAAWYKQVPCNGVDDGLQP